MASTATRVQTALMLTPKAVEVLERYRAIFGKGDTCSAALVAFDLLDGAKQVQAVKEAQEPVAETEPITNAIPA